MSNFFTPEFNNESAIAPWNASLEPTQGIIPQLDANRALTGDIGQEVNIPTLTPEAYDNIILPDASLSRMVSSVSTESDTSLPDSSVDVLTGEAMSEVYEDLSKFAAQPDFVAKLNLAFGENWDAAAAKALAEGWFQGDFSDIPQVKVLSSAEIGGANGAFAEATDTIYLSKEFLTGNAANPAAVADVLLEEIGHSVDARLNVADSPGDEGAIFSAIVQGKELSEGEIQGLKSEDDSAKINLSRSNISIEMSQIPMASLNGRLYQSHRGNDNNIYTRSSTDGINWTNWNNNGGGATLNAPSLAAFNGRLYQSHRGYDNNIYTRSSSDGVNWSGWAQSGGATQSAPTLAAVNGRLYQSHRGFDNNIYTRSSTDGVNWSGWAQSGGGTPTAPTLAAYNGRLYQSHRGFDGNKIYTRSSTDGINWTGWNEAGGGTPSYPTMAEFNGRLYQTHRGFDNNLIYIRSSTNGVNWTGWTSINRSTPTAASMTAFNGRLYLTHQGLDDKIYMSSSTDGINWGQWIERGGATPTDSDNSPISSPIPTPVSGNPKLDIQLVYPYGGFTNAQRAIFEQAAQNWESVITKDKVPNGVLKIAITQGSTSMGGGGNLAAWIGAETYPADQEPPKTRWDWTPNIDGENRINFNSANINGFSKNNLIRLTMHEIGHTLGLNEAQNDSSLYDIARDSLMDLRTPAQGGQDMKITEGMNKRLESLGYGVNRSPNINWY